MHHINIVQHLCSDMVYSLQLAALAVRPATRACMSRLLAAFACPRMSGTASPVCALVEVVQVVRASTYICL